MNCEHPKDKLKNWHDNSVLCNECGCIIEQNGKKIEDPSPLFRSPITKRSKQPSLTMEEVVGLLRDIEWNVGSSPCQQCPKCRNTKARGHRDDCSLIGLIYKLEDKTIT